MALEGKGSASKVIQRQCQIKKTTMDLPTKQIHCLFEVRITIDRHV
jgi:hypothetical protein